MPGRGHAILSIMDEVLLRELFEGDPTAACVAGPDGGIRACNPGFVQLFAFPDATAACEARLDTLLADPGAWGRAIGALAAGRAPHLFEADGRTLDGQTLHLAGSLCARPGSAGEVMAWFRDVTDQRRLEQDLLAQARQMEIVSRLTRGAAHDINNMLMVIVGYSEVLVKDLPEEGRGRRILGEMHKATNRAAALTQQLLDVARRPDLRVEELSLATVVEESADLIRRLVGGDVTLEIRADPGARRIRADRGQIVQVLLNLTANARDTMPAGGRISLEVANVDVGKRDRSERPSMAPGAYAVLRVADTGAGMDHEALERVRAGTGLSVVVGIIKECGGSLWCESEPGQGSVFSVYLPAAP
jgi:two-component system cell cycle sensor histidine kinase/response regulator CckA